MFGTMLACGRHLERRARLDEEVLHVDHDECGASWIELVDDAQIATHVGDADDDIGGQVGLAHGAESVTHAGPSPTFACIADTVSGSRCT